MKASALPQPRDASIARIAPGLYLHAADTTWGPFVNDGALLAAAGAVLLDTDTLPEDLLTFDVIALSPPHRIITVTAIPAALSLLARETAERERRGDDTDRTHDSLRDGGPSR